MITVDGAIAHALGYWLPDAAVTTDARGSDRRGFDLRCLLAPPVFSHGHDVPAGSLHLAPASGITAVPLSANGITQCWRRCWASPFHRVWHCRDLRPGRCPLRRLHRDAGLEAGGDEPAAAVETKDWHWCLTMPLPAAAPVRRRRPC
jgi:hypothetical protein